MITNRFYGLHCGCGLILVTLLVIVCPGTAQESSSDRAWVVIAHRGASAYLPEHTLAAKALAHGMGADYIEQDVVLSRDGVPLVLHDIHLDAVTDVARIYPGRTRGDGRYYAADFDLEELRRLRLRERMGGDGQPRYPGRFPPGWSRFGIATLSEEIELIQGLNHSRGTSTGLYTEIKSPAWHRGQGLDVSAAVLETLSRYGYDARSDEVYVQCFDPAELNRIRSELGSDLKLVQLISDNDWNEAEADYVAMRSGAGLREIARYADGIGPAIDHVLISRDGRLQATPLVAEAHRHGLLVHPYTLRRDLLPEGGPGFDEYMKALFLDAGVDGIFTDFPDLAVEYFRRSGSR